MKYKVLYIFMMFLLSVSCSKDAVEEYGPAGNVPEGYVRARVTLSTMEFEQVHSRVLPESDEISWDHVYVAQFDNGTLLPETVHRYPEGNFNILLKQSSNSIVYFITNATVNPFLKDGYTSPTDYVTTLTEFENKKYEPTSTVPGDQIPDGDRGDRLVMVGVYDQPVTSDSSGPVSQLLVYVERVTAKLDVIIQVDQNKVNPGYQVTNPLVVKSAQIRAVPTATTYTKRQIVTDVAELGDLPIVNDPQHTEQSSTAFHIMQLPTYYILENNYGERGTGTQTNHAPKNEAAPEDASGNYLSAYVDIKAYINDGYNVGDVDYTIFLGENPYNNFSTIRNTHYTVTITLQGAGIYNVDIRADHSSVRTIYYTYLNGRPATGRASEVSVATGSDLTWGDKAVGGNTAPPSSMAHLRVNSGDGTWGFRIDGYQNAPVHPWDGVSVDYMPEGQTAWIAAPITITDGVIYYNGPGLPSRARFRIHLGVNDGVTARTLGVYVYNTEYPATEKLWRVEQSPQDVFTVPRRYIISNFAGRYAVPVRSLGMYWKVNGLSTTRFTVVDVLDENSNPIPGYQTDFYNSHGYVILEAPAHTGSSYTTAMLFLETKPSLTSEVTADTINLHQISNARRYQQTANTIRKQYFGYSSDPMFYSMFPMNLAMLWGINILNGPNTDYEVDETKVGAHSPYNGKENTLKIVNAIDRAIAPNASNIPYTLVRNTPVVTPAALCMSLNENWEGITSVDDPNFQWYLPARYEAIQDITGLTLRPDSMFSNANLDIWSSTTATTRNTERRYSAYVGGSSVDYSGLHVTNARVRCIRKRDFAAEGVAQDYHTYPYLTATRGTGKPMIVVQETVDGRLKGYNYNYASAAVYKIGRPLRFTTASTGTSIDGRGPTDFNETTLSPRFQVAMADAPISGTSTTGNWRMAAGWNDAQNDLLSPATGCEAYSEDGLSDWRVPTMMELRVMTQLGIANTTGLDSHYGGMSFSDFPGFIYCSGNYWSSKDQNDGRGVHINMTTTNLSGSATTKTVTTYRVRCVRDLGVGE